MHLGKAIHLYGPSEKDYLRRMEMCINEMDIDILQYFGLKKIITNAMQMISSELFLSFSQQIE